MTQDYIWKGPRDKQGNHTEIKMVDMSSEELQKAYNHCKEMLYSTNKKHTGRMTIINYLYKAIKYCNTELCFRWFTSEIKNENNEPKFNRTSLLNELRSWVASLPTKEQSSDLLLSEFVEVPSEFNKIKIKHLMDACTDTLGGLDHSLITYPFLYKMGIWLTSKEIRDIDKFINKNDNSFYESRKTISFEERLGVIRFWLQIEDNDKLHYDSKGLTLHQFTDMIHLKNYKGFIETKYADLTTSQLITLRDKVLNVLINKITQQANNWQELLAQLEEVANEKNIELC